MRLTVETGPLAGTVVPLDRESPATLGSGTDCAIRIQEAGVQVHHAVVKALRGEGFGLKALAAGVRLNGQQVEASPLTDGDVIEIGTTRVAFGEVQKKGLPHVAGYRVLEELGRGGMGVVFRAEQTSLHREVALKVLSHDLTQDPQFVARFVAEAQAAAKLQHPNVVSVFDVEHDGDTYFYAMELMHNGSCEDWLKQNGAMPVDRALQVIADAAAGLAYAESLGIVHRDIKPDNLMLDQHGVVKIADLGLAGDQGDSDRAIGTPHFMAPEQVLKKPLDHRTDLYALGCTFYRLVTGRTPFRGATVKDILRAQVKDDPEPAHKVNNKIPVEVSARIQRLMQKEPGQRYQTANALLEDLDVLLRPPHKKGLWIGLAAAGVLIAGGAIYWAINKPKEQTIVEKYRDNPEMLKLATENEKLRSEALESASTIALLTARVSGLADEPLAAALDQVAKEHPGTRAAVEAGERATRVRAELHERTLRTQQQKTKVADHLANLAQAISPLLLANDFQRATAALAAPAPGGLENDADLEQGVQKLRDQVLAAARARITQMVATIDGAAAKKDTAALRLAVDALRADLASTERYPKQVRADLDAAEQRATAATATLAGLQDEHRENLWIRYRALFLGPDGIGSKVNALDFAAAAATAQAFAQATSGEEAASRAQGLAEAAQKAAAFADALATAAAAGTLQMEGQEGASLVVQRWDREHGQFALVDAARRGGKEQLVAAGALSDDDWFRLVQQVETPEPGADKAFLAFVLLARHARTATAYLGRCDGKNDTSGTGDAGYPLAGDSFDRLLRALPEPSGAAAGPPWLAFLRDEVDAGRRLAAALRALSERRNLAAAGHIEKLLGEHAHSMLVAVLP